MPLRKYFIDGMTFYKYCKLHNLQYTHIAERIRAYNLSPEEAISYTKRSERTKILREHGITSNDPNYTLYYGRISAGWDAELAIKTPKLHKGGDWRKKQLDKFKYKE